MRKYFICHPSNLLSGVKYIFILLVTTIFRVQLLNLLSSKLPFYDKSLRL